MHEVVYMCLAFSLDYVWTVNSEQGALNYITLSCDIASINGPPVNPLEMSDSFKPGSIEGGLFNKINSCHLPELPWPSDPIYIFLYKRNIHVQISLDLMASVGFEMVEIYWKF